MATGDTYQRIRPTDRWIFNSDGDLVGIQNPRGNSGDDLRFAENSAIGSITASELATTTGTTGQAVRLSDGDDQGAILMWSTPAGATAETWCWWLWPQSAYL